MDIWVIAGKEREKVKGSITMGSPGSPMGGWVITGDAQTEIDATN